ncbi:hypothetical protein BC629DRAFT_1594158 [Irpex lacteus]|nr:hypothetical protein BC629DRAFT_1594158 [Irpex lacteus]
MADSVAAVDANGSAAILVHKATALAEKRVHLFHSSTLFAILPRRCWQMSFVQGKRVRFVDVLATPLADRERYGAPYPSVAQLGSRGDRRSNADLYWGEHPLSSAGLQHSAEDEDGDQTYVVCDTTAEVDERDEAASTAPIITLTAAVENELVKSLTSLSISPNAKPRPKHPLSQSWGDEDMSDTLSPPSAGPPSLFVGSSSGFTSTSCATTPDEDLPAPFFDTYAFRCDTSTGKGVDDVSVFEHLGNQ